MNEIEKKILNEIQNNFPVVSKPFAEIGNRTGISEEKVLEILSHLKKDGILRRIGALFDKDKFSFASALIALSAESDCIDDVVKKINSIKGVTHNYRRNHHYNIWFTLSAETKEIFESELAEIRRMKGVKDLMSLPCVKQFKLRAVFNL